MMKNGDYPYWAEEAYQDVLDSKADYIVLMLGTNDAKF
jgi:acyl-CoA thioesterase-1